MSDPGHMGQTLWIKVNKTKPLFPWDLYSGGRSEDLEMKVCRIRTARG